MNTNVISEVTFDGKKILKVFEPCNCYTAVKRVKELIATKAVDPSRYTQAVIEYWGKPSGDPDVSENYPLRFYDEMDTMELWVCGIKIGGYDTATETTISALKAMGFYVIGEQEEEIYKKPRKVHIFKKN